MNEHIARITSSFFNPILHPLYCILVVIYAFQYRYANVPDKLWNLTVITILVMTTLFPILISLIFKKLDMVNENDLSAQKKRIFPMLIFFFFYLMTFLIIKPREHNSYVFLEDILLSTVILGATLTIVVSFFINNFIYLCLHTVAISNIFMLVCILSRSSNMPLFLFIAISLLLVGIIGSARIYLGKHSSKEVYYGFGAGIVGQIIAFMSYINF